MYLISVYFDDAAERMMQRYIEEVANKTGNMFMIDGQVPPHITISALETKQEDILVEKLEKVVQTCQAGNVQWASVGVFFPYVLYVAPVLNSYLHNLSKQIYEEIKGIQETKISPYYRPFQWCPHTTIGKKLTKEQMKMGFQVMQDSFGMFQGRVVRIGLAKTNPYREIKNWELK